MILRMSGDGCGVAEEALCCHQSESVFRRSARRRFARGGLSHNWAGLGSAYGSRFNRSVTVLDSVQLVPTAAYGEKRQATALACSRISGLSLRSHVVSRLRYAGGPKRTVLRTFRWEVSV